MVLLSGLTDFSYATFGYRKAHRTNDEILHHTKAYPQVEFYQVQCYN